MNFNQKSRSFTLMTFMSLFVCAFYRCNVPLFGKPFANLVSTHITRYFTQCASVQFYIVFTPCLWNIRTQFTKTRLSDVRSQMDVILGILMGCINIESQKKCQHLPSLHVVNSIALNCKSWSKNNRWHLLPIHANDWNVPSLLNGILILIIRFPKQEKKRNNLYKSYIYYL